MSLELPIGFKLQIANPSDLEASSRCLYPLRRGLTKGPATDVCFHGDFIDYQNELCMIMRPDIQK